LHRKAAGLEREQQRCGLILAQPDADAENRRDRDDRAVDQADDEGSHDRGGSRGEELPNLDPHALRRRRLLGRRCCDGKQRERNQRAHHHEQAIRPNIAEADAERRQHQGDLGADHVDRQDASAMSGAGAGADPAVRHREDAGQRDARQSAQEDPCKRGMGLRHHEDQDGYDGRKACEGPDITDMPDEARSQETTGRETEAVGRRDDTDGSDRDPFCLHAQGHQGLQQSIAGLKQRGCCRNGPDECEGGVQDRIVDEKRQARGSRR
jgi:hypothetical protein